MKNRENRGQALRPCSGQAVVEFVMGFWIFLFGLAALIFLTQVSLARLIALEAAQLGTDLQAHTNLSKETISALLLEQIRREKYPSRWLWSLEMNPPSSVPAARFYNLVQTKVKVQIKEPLVLEEAVAVQKEPYE